MATLQKIRNHGPLLLVIVGLAMLAFIFGDFLRDGNAFFHRNREYVAVISDKNISYLEFKAAQDDLEQVLKMQNQNTSDEAAQQQIRDKVWQWFVLENALGKEAQIIGLDVTQKDKEDMLNQMQAFDPRQKEIYDSNSSFQSYVDKEFYTSMLQQKYMTLINGLVRVNSLDAKFAFNARQADVNVDYVCQPYSVVPNSQVTINNADLKRLYNLHKQEYKREPNRAIEYICFDIVPSEADFKAVEDFMKSVQEDFSTTEDIASLLSTANSNIPYNGLDYSAETVPARFKDFAFAKGAKEGQVTELLLENNTYSMARIMKAGYSLPDSVELKFIGSEEGQEETDWVVLNQLDKATAQKIINTKKGNRITIPVGMGELTIEVLDFSRATPKVQLAILERTVIPSSTTNSAIHNKVSQFILANKTDSAFKAAAKEQGLTCLPQYNLTKNTPSIGALTNSRQIVRWAFEAKKGQISPSYRCGNQFVVALLTEINDGEYFSFEEKRAALEIEAINEKKAQFLMNEAKGVQSLEEAAELFGTEIQTAEHINLASSFFANVGPEPAVIGAAMAMEDNTISEPIQGNYGVYIIKTGVKVTANNEIDLEAEKKQLAQRNAYRIPYQALLLIEKNADITDNRANFY